MIKKYAFGVFRSYILLIAIHEILGYFIDCFASFFLSVFVEDAVTGRNQE